MKEYLGVFDASYYVCAKIKAATSDEAVSKFKCFLEDVKGINYGMKK